MRKISENKTILIASLISYITFAVNILVTIFYTPFMKDALGEVEYGIRSFALSFSSFTSLLGLGISSSYLRFANLANKKDGEAGVKRINGLFIKIYGVIALATVALGAILVSAFIFKIIPLSNYSSEEQTTIIWIVALSFIQAAITFATCVFPLSIVYHKRFIFRNSMFLLSTIISHGAWIVLLLLGYKSVALSVVGLIIEVIFHAINYIFMTYGLKEKIDLKGNKEDKKLFIEILIFSFFSFLVTVTTTLNTSVDKIILGFIDNEVDLYVTKYSLSVIFNSYLITAASTISVLFDPRINELAIKGDKEGVQKIYDNVTFICTLLLTLIVFGFIACGENFICAWLGENNRIVYLFSIPLMFVNIIIYPQTFSLQIQRANNKHKFSAFIYAGSFILNIILSITFVFVFQKVGLSPIWSCILGTIISYSIETLGMSIYNTKVLGLKQTRMWLDILINVIVGAVAYFFVRKVILISGIVLSEYSFIIQTIIQGSIFVVLFIFLELLVNYKKIKQFLLTYKQKKS